MRQLTAAPESLEADALIDQARAAIAHGQRVEARRFLWAVLKSNPHNATAWLILAALGSPRASLNYVAHALEARPHDPIARAALRWARKRLSPESPPRVEQRERADASAGASPFPFGLVLLAALVAVGAIATIAIGGGFQDSRQEVAVAMALSSAKATRTPVPTDTPTVTPSPTPTASPAPSPTATQPINPVARASTGGGGAGHWIDVDLSRQTVTAMDGETPIPPTATPFPSSTFLLPSQPARDDVFTPPQSIPSNSGGERWIDVDLSKQTLIAYEGATVARTLIVSSGALPYETVTGHFKIYQKYETVDLYGPDFFQPAVPYVMMFYPHFALHAATWHDDFGKPVSHGCINLRMADAAWLYSWAPVGARVEIVHWH
ncbi:MAG: L,D-transpeptidase family protein [Chloroflexi bacterium]|nr:L,D-transpeptidase family protein [Chloroflexota bacterium]